MRHDKDINTAQNKHKYMLLKWNYSGVLCKYICSSHVQHANSITKQNAEVKRYTGSDRSGRSTNYATGCRHTRTDTLTHTNLGHPVALQLDLPLGHSQNETDKSPTDGS